MRTPTMRDDVRGGVGEGVKAVGEDETAPVASPSAIFAAATTD